VQGAQTILPHQTRNAMLATGLSGFAQIREYAWRPVDAVSGDERGADQPQQPGVFLCSPRDRLLTLN
jgi:hypothetical protein